MGCDTPLLYLPLTPQAGPRNSGSVIAVTLQDPRKVGMKVQLGNLSPGPTVDPSMSLPVFISMQPQVVTYEGHSV